MLHRRDEVKTAYELELEKEHAAFDGEFWEEPDEIDFTDEFTRAAGVVRQNDDGGDGEDRRRHLPQSENSGAVAKGSGIWAGGGRWRPGRKLLPVHRPSASRQSRQLSIVRKILEMPTTRMCIHWLHCSIMKDVGLRIRVQRDLREQFLEVCRAQDKPAAQVLREYMREYVERHEAVTELDRKRQPGQQKK